MKVKSIITMAVVLVSASMLTSCHIYQKFDIEKQDSALATEYSKAKTEVVDSTSFGNLRWEEVFTDPVLADLIRQALAQNVDLDNAKLNVDIAHANMRGARLGYLPSLALSAQGGAGGNKSFHLSGWNYTIPLTASWEIDVFAKTLNSKRGAEASYQRMKDYQQAVRSQIIGAVANCYYGIAALQSQIKLSEETAEIWKENVEVMKNYKTIGITNEAAVVQAEANYLGILANLTDLRTSLHELNNSLALLLRKQPQIFSIPNLEDYAAPQIALNDVPMSQLASRPDVRAAEGALAVAYYSTNSARAAFYPTLSISANYGFTNLFGSNIINPGDWISSVAGSLVAPIFSRGKLKANLDATKAQQKQALNNFENTLLSASAEVSNAITLFRNNAEKAVHLDAEVENLVKAESYTKDLFAAGSATYLEVLTAQSSLLQAQTSQISCRLAQAQAVINLYQSLGGGR